MSRNFYVYIYKNPLKNNDPFYVGKGKGDRFLYHLKEKKSVNPHKSNTIKQIRTQGLEPIIEIYINNLIENDAFEVEKNLIKFFGRRNIKTGGLTNLTDGGEGVSGVIWSNEHRQIQAKRMKGNHNTLGRKMPPEEVERRASKLRGKKQTPEFIKKRTEALKGRHHSEESKTKMSNARKGLIFVRDLDGKCFKTTSTNPRYISGELVGVSKGRNWFHNPNTLEQKCCIEPPDGFIKGRI